MPQDRRGGAVRRRPHHQPAQHRQAERAAPRPERLSDRARSCSSRRWCAARSFANFAFPALIAPPMMTRYKPGMRYGAHADAALSPAPGGDDPQRFELHDLPQRSRRIMRAARFTSGSATPDLRFKLAARRGDRLSVGHAARGRAGDQGRAAGRDHLHPEPHPGPVPPQHAVRAQRGRRARGAEDGPGEFHPAPAGPGKLLRHWGDKP